MNALRTALQEYLAVRRALGAQLREPAQALDHFVTLLEREGAEFITTDIALRWACEPQGVQPATWARRLTAVRRFATWLGAFDPRTQVPPLGLIPGRHRRPKPYIFTQAQVEDLMAAAARLQSPKGLRALTHLTLIGLLSATGLRPGEALALTIADVDLQSGILKIRLTKFGKSRFVPVHESTRAALERYARQRDTLFARRDTEAFFVSERGTRLEPHGVRRTFALVSSAVGLRAPAMGKRIGRGPRLQDLRHTFATRRLVEWYGAGQDVTRQMPMLTTYLGHATAAETYWYIESVPELLDLATEDAAVRHQRGAR
jgi:integrase